MANYDKVARWLNELVKKEEFVDQNQALEKIKNKFGDEYIENSDDQSEAISPEVLKLFREIRSEGIRWNPGLSAWIFENKQVETQSHETVEGDEMPKAVRARKVPSYATVDHPSLYFNQELGWLDFNWRVLYQAVDKRTPLLERIKFIAITVNNLDEFIQKRLGGLKRQREARVTLLSPDGRNPQEQIELVTRNTRLMLEKTTSIWNDNLKPELERNCGVKISSFSELTDLQKEKLNAYFDDRIYPILTPLGVDPAHPFPFISNLSLSLAVSLNHPGRNTTFFARVKIPSNQSRWLRVEDIHYNHHFILLEDLIKNNIHKLFKGMKINDCFLFRVTRNADLRRDEEEAEDLLNAISEELRERRFANVVRLEVEKGANRQALNLLQKELEITSQDVFFIDGMLDLTACFEVSSLDYPQYQYRNWEPITPKAFQHEGESEPEQNVFNIIKRGDILVHHPYENFSSSVVRLIEEAAHDPQVIAIKQTLYRTSENSPIVASLVKAAEKGKQVAVLIEVKARFDEANNIEWAQMLENSGVHVAYGLVGLKTHSKVALVIRKEEEGPVAYCHIGTGNYHVKTARLYTDFGLMTRNKEIGNDAINLFHYLTGYAPEQNYKHLVVAPRDMRKIFFEKIDREIAIQQSGGKGYVMAKMNALDDVKTVAKLYEASRAGVKIDLIVRGHTRIRPGIKGFSENIQVISIIGRFLEHDRVFYFQNGGNDEVFIGSADWRRRNLDDRVEVMVPIYDKRLKKRLIKILKNALKDNRLAWELKSDGTYQLRQKGEESEVFNYHEWLMNDALTRNK